MASSKVQVYNLLPDMCTLTRVNEICGLFGLEQNKVVKFDHSEDVEKHDKTATLTLTLSGEVSLSKDRIDYQGRQLFAMPEMVDGAFVTLNKLWTDKLTSSELRKLVDNNVKIVTNNGVVTLKGDNELVYNNVAKIKDVILNILLKTEHKTPRDVSKQQQHGHGNGRREIDSANEVCGITVGSSAPEENIHDAPVTGTESESQKVLDSGRSASSEDPEDVDHKLTALMGKMNLEDPLNNPMQPPLTTSSSHATDKHVTVKKTSVPDDTNATVASSFSMPTDPSTPDDNKTTEKQSVDEERSRTDYDNDRYRQNAGSENDEYDSETRLSSPLGSGDDFEAAASLNGRNAEDPAPRGTDANAEDTSRMAGKDPDMSVTHGLPKSNAKLVIGKQFWDYILFIDADEHSWCRELTVSTWEDAAQQVVLDGEDVDIDEVRKYCEKLSIQGGVVARKVSAPNVCQFDVFKRELLDLSKDGRVMINYSSSSACWELIGLKSDVRKLSYAIDIRMSALCSTEHETEELKKSSRDIAGTQISSDNLNLAQVNSLTPDVPINGNRKPFDVETDSTISTGMPVGAKCVGKKVQSKNSTVEMTGLYGVDKSATKHVIDEPLWEFIKFSYPDSGWGSKFSDVRTHGNGGQLELTGAAADVAELDLCCGTERLRRAVVLKVMAIPQGCNVDTFKELVTGADYKRKVLVRATNDAGYCELIGRKNDVQEVISRAERDFPRNTAVDDDDKNEHCKQTTLGNPTAAGDGDASRKSSPVSIPYRSTWDKLEFETPRSKVKVSVVTGDILKQSCEVIVSPANTNLYNNQGLAQKIEVAVGREMTDDIRWFLATNHRLNVSQVMKTRAGKLFPPCRSIIHACGPNNRPSSKADDCFDLLRTTFLNCFILANDDIKARSIAVPAISAGASGLSLDVVARAAYSALMSFDERLAKGQRKYLDSICFANIDKETTIGMTRTFTDGLSSSSSPSGAQGTHLPSAVNMATNSKFGNATTSPSNNSPLVKNNPAAALDKPEFVTPKSNVKVSFVTGDLLEQRCEVLVCPTDGTSSNNSRLATALDSKAGRASRDEYNNYIITHGNMQVTEVMDTGPGTLNSPVRRIIYAAGPLSSSSSQCFDLLRKTFLKCYIHANECIQARSIALPSICPGGAYGLSYDVISGALSASLLLFDDYLRNAPVRHLGIICVADLNREMTAHMIQRFQAELTVFTPSTGTRGNTDNLNLAAQTGTTSIHLTGGSTSSNGSSVRTHPPVTSKSEFVTPKSKIKVIVVTDDVLEQRCEVLVCPTDANLNNTSGLAQAIQSRAGRQSKNDCTDYFINHGSLRVTQIMDTRPGRLYPPAKRIIYAYGPYKKFDSTMDQCFDLLHSTLMNCFKHANDRIQASSIAVPAFGTGGALSLPRSVIASAASCSLMMFDDHVSNVGTKHLEMICFANKDSELTTRMVEAFQKEMSPSTTLRDVHPDNQRSQTYPQPSVVRHTLTELEKRAKELGFIVVDVPSDDDSAPNAIIDQLKQQGIHVYDTRSLRQQTATYLRRNPVHIDESHVQSMHGGNVELFLSRQVAGRSYFESSMIKGVAEVIGKEIRVLDENGQLDAFQPSRTSGKHLTLGVDSGWHYVSLRCAPDSQATHGSNCATDEWLKGNSAHRGDTNDEKDERAHQGKYKITKEDSHQKTTKATATSLEASCPICMDDIQEPKTLRCGHTFCTDCIDQHFSYQMKCPCCGEIFGELKGDQPKDGTMQVSTEYYSLEGYPSCGRIVINYHIPGGKQQANHPNPGKWYKGAHRTAYLPDNTEGREICTLLRRAFDAGLIFTVGRSTTSGQEDVVTWNDIHHKTKTTGPYGYPDAGYLDRVRDELAAKGISSSSASSTTTGAAAATNRVTNSSVNCPPSSASIRSASSSTSASSAGAKFQSSIYVSVSNMTTRSMSPVNNSTTSTVTAKVGQHQTPPFNRSSSYKGPGVDDPRFSDSSWSGASAGWASSSSSTTTTTQPATADRPQRRKRDSSSPGVEGPTNSPPYGSPTVTSTVSNDSSQRRQLAGSPVSDASGIERLDGSSSRRSAIGKSVAERQKIFET